MGALREFVDNLVESFANVFRFDVRPDLDERENVEKVISESALVAGMIASLQPIPMADMLVLAPLHAKMVLHVGRIKGHEITDQRALDMVREIIGTVWMHLTAQALIGVLGKLIPPARLLLTFPLNYAATYAIGKVAEYYFECLGRGVIPSTEAMKDLFAEQLRVGKARGRSFDAQEMKARAEALRQRVMARDTDLATHTRLEPRTGSARTRGMAPETAPPAADPSGADEGPRRKIKIVLEPRGDEEPDPPAADAPVAKTMGPGDERPEVEVRFKGAPKTLWNAQQAGEPDPAAPTLEELLPGLPVDPPGGPALSPAPASTTPAEPPPEDGGDEGEGLVEQLERLASLLERGVIDRDEFERVKAKLLDAP